MQKLSVSEAAEVLGVSREAIYNRIRRNTLQTLIEDGVKYVILDNNEKANTPKTNTIRKQKNVSNDDRYIELLMQNIEELKQKVSNLELQKDELNKQKEELLIESRNEIERIYKDRDKQLKDVITLVTKPMLTYFKKREIIDADYEELTPFDRDIMVTKTDDKWQNLEEYMEQKGYSEQKRKEINSQIVAKVGFNKNIKEENGVLFIKRGKKIKKILKSEVEE